MSGDATSGESSARPPRRRFRGGLPKEALPDASLR